MIAIKLFFTFLAGANLACVGYDLLTGNLSGWTILNVVVGLMCMAKAFSLAEGPFGRTDEYD